MLALQLVTELILYVGIGIFLEKRRMVSDDFDRQLSVLFTDIILPCMIFQSLQLAFDPQDLKNCAVLLVLSRQNELYRLAGICQLLALAVSGTLILLYHSAPPVWTLLLSIPAAAVSLYGAYREFTAHADAAQLTVTLEEA